MKKHAVFSAIAFTLYSIVTINSSQGQEIIRAGIQWDETKARQVALKHIERQVNLQYFQAKDTQYFENVKFREQNPDQRFTDRQVTHFSTGEYSVAFNGENRVHYYHADGSLFKVSVCSKPFGDDWDYPRRCIDYRYPDGEFLNVSMDVSPEETYVYSLEGKLLQHWKDDQGFAPNDKTRWERASDAQPREAVTPMQITPNTLPK